MSLLVNSLHLPRIPYTTMLSLNLNTTTATTTKPPSLSSPFLAIRPLPPSSFNNPLPSSRKLSKTISATITPSSNPSQQKQQLYQPFRPPPSPIPPQFQSLDTNGRLEILSNRLGLWFDYAPLIPSLTQQGFTPSTLEEITGISGVEQNRLVVAAKVRDSLLQSKLEPDTLAFFDLGGSELLYEIRLLSASERAAAARYIVDNKLDARGAQDLARAMKDFPRRKGDRGWSNFNYVLPGDCLAFVYYRQALEHQNPEHRKLAMEKALQTAAISEAAKKTIMEDMEGEGIGKGTGGGVMDGVKVPVVRMQVGEVAEATSVVVLPVCRAEEKEREVVDAPWECGTQGDFGIVVAEKGWRRWVVLPGWEPVAGLKKGGVVVAFADARALPWRVNRWYKEEAILVVADRGRKEVAGDDGFYLVSNNEDGLKVERGSALKEKGMKESLGTVLVVVRPPREENDNQLADEDWE